MAPQAYEWDPRPPSARERVICGIFLAAFVPVVINYYAGWRLFGGYDNWVFGGFGLAALFLFARLPGVRRVEGVRQPISYWLTIGLGIAVAAILLLIRSQH